MAYEKQTWVNGDVITQEKLNHMEDGIENAYELPSVTETDNGKVLGVEDGQFGLVSGGKSSLITITPEDFLAFADDNDAIDTYDVLVSAIRKNPYTVGATSATTLIHIPRPGALGFGFYKGSGNNITEINMRWDLLLVDAYAQGMDMQTANLGFGAIFSLSQGVVSSVAGRTPAASVASCSYRKYYNGKYYTLIGLLGASATKVSYTEITE